MSKKHTIEFVKASFESVGYELLEDSYVNSKTKMKYRCPEGHESSIKFNDWQQGHKCYACANTINGTIKRMDIKYIQKQFELEGYELLENNYTNNNTKMKYKCPEGHEYIMAWGAWQAGTRCKICSNKVRGINRRHDINYIRSEFEKEGYELLEDNYVGAHTKMKYRCPEGHEHSTKWSKWDTGRRCPTCRNLRRFGSGNVNWRGGLSFEPYCEVWKDKEFKLDIKERDDNKCNNPDCWCTTDKLAIHHIDYDKKNCHPDNLITLCVSCNGRANKNRELHEKFYKAINSVGV